MSTGVSFTLEQNGLAPLPPGAAACDCIPIWEWMWHHNASIMSFCTRTDIYYSLTTACVLFLPNIKYVHDDITSVLKVE